jgi:FkbM family methyltransferase
MAAEPPAILKTIKKLITRKNFSETDFIYDFFLKEKAGSSKERVLIDVGAHYGLTMLKFAEAGWKVICFEPDDNNRAVLEKLVSDKKLKDVIVDGRAVSDHEGMAKYYSSDVSTGISGLLKFHPSHREAKNVEIVTLSSFCKENKITGIDFLKIDTEGNDLKVIKGLDLNRNRPKVIICEYEDAKTQLAGYSKVDMTEYIEAGGYRCIISEWYPVVEYGTKHKWRRLTDDIKLVDGNSWGNIIAAEPETHQSLLKAITGRASLRKNLILSRK